MFKKVFALLLCIALSLSSVAFAEAPDITELTLEEKTALLDELLANLEDALISAALSVRFASFDDEALTMLNDLIDAEIAFRNIPTLQTGSKGEEVRLLQQRLIDLNYLSGSADGSFGNKTAEAVRSFQQQVSLEQTGIADPETQKALYSDDAPKAVTEAAPEVTSSSTNAGGMRPEIKEAIDSYEAFFDEYCEFMKKYEESNNSLAMLGDYLSFMGKYADTMSKLDALEEDLNDAELTYYLAATSRITQKLLEVAY